MFHQSRRITKIQKSTHIVTTPPSYFAIRKCKYMFKPHYKASRPAKMTNEQHPLGAFLRTSRARADGEQTGTRLPHAIHASLYRFSQKRDVSQIGSNGIYRFPDAASEGHVAWFPVAKAKPVRGHIRSPLKSLGVPPAGIPPRGSASGPSLSSWAQHTAQLIYTTGKLESRFLNFRFGILLLPRLSFLFTWVIFNSSLKTPYSYSTGKWKTLLWLVCSLIMKSVFSPW